MKSVRILEFATILDLNEILFCECFCHLGEQRQSAILDFLISEGCAAGNNSKGMELKSEGTNLFLQQALFTATLLRKSHSEYQNVLI